MRLTTGDGTEIIDPSDEQIRGILAGMEAEDGSFAAYEDDHGSFVQFAGDPGGYYTEYHDGSTGMHHHAVGYPVLEEAMAMVRALRAGESVVALQQWEREGLTMKAAAPQSPPAVGAALFGSPSTAASTAADDLSAQDAMVRVLVPVLLVLMGAALWLAVGGYLSATRAP
jgi:hypothetical protein